LDGFAEQGFYAFVALGGGMDAVGGESFLVVAAVVGRGGVIVNERVVFLIREIFEPIV